MPVAPSLRRIYAQGYDAQRQGFVNQLKAIVGLNPVACYLPHRSDDTTSTDPISGRIWTAETITNLVTNGGFETNTTGWTTGGTNTIASSLTQFWSLTRSCLFTYSNNAVYASYAITVAAAGTYQFSISVFIPTNFDGQGISVTDNGSFAGATITVATADMTKTNQWQRLNCQMVIVGGDLVGTLVVLGTGTAPTATRTLFFDGAQMELGGVPTPYIETNGGTATGLGHMNAASLSPLGLGTVRSFDGISQYLTTPDTANMSFGNSVTDVPFSVMAVANVTTSGVARAIISKAGSGFPNFEYNFVVQATTNTLIDQIVDASASATSQQASNAAVPLSSYVTLGGSYNGVGGASAGNGIVLYVNGVAVAETVTNNASYVAMEDGTSTPAIGAVGAGLSQLYLGTIGCVVVVPALVTAAQFLAFHTAARTFYQF